MHRPETTTSDNTPERAVLVVMHRGASEADLTAVESLARRRARQVETSCVAGCAILTLRGAACTVDPALFACQRGVARAFGLDASFPKASTERGQGTVPLEVGALRFGGEAVQVIAGPCAVRDEEQLEQTAARLASLGVRVMRAGAFKPRTSPYSYQGAGLEGLRLLRSCADRHRLLVLSEVMDPALVSEVAACADIVQLGARSMYNYPLLREVGRCGKPVLIKRGMSATYDELLGAAEYVLLEGNDRVMLCERGIRTFSAGARATLDVAAVPLLKSRARLPVLVDPSHAAGCRSLVEPLACAAIAAGADAIVIEVEQTPDDALSDASQTLDFAQLEALLARVARVASAVGRELALGADRG
jgi:3-deoxy-7-phosphoheptulonate synthase